MLAMMTTTRLLVDNEGKDRVAMTMRMAMRVMRKEEAEGGKAMAMEMAMRVAGERMDILTKRVMTTKKREAGKEEGNCKGGKSDGNGEEDSDGK